jgi:hypothetical protein
LAVIHFIILHESCSIAAAGTTVVNKKTIDYLSKTYDYTDSWCPGAVWHDSDVCHPCQRRFLIVIATGRSASTTLTHMLGSLPGVRMSGENYNMLGLIRNLFDTVQKHVHPEVAMKDAWAHNPVPKGGAFACAAQRAHDGNYQSTCVSRKFNLVDKRRQSNHYWLQNDSIHCAS